MTIDGFGDVKRLATFIITTIYDSIYMNGDDYRQK